MHGEAEATEACCRREETLFERCWWLYALCREHLFTDHTDEIATALAPILESSAGNHLLEVGCGPGFYARRLAARFPQTQITGIDLSEPLLSLARKQAQRSHLDNCRFLRADALSLTDFPEQADAAIASRLFLILANRPKVLHAIFQTLRPGGLFFIAEPRSRLRAGLPLRLMRMFDAATGHTPGLTVPLSCDVLMGRQFEELIDSQPWSKVHVWRDRGYQCALCEKPA